MKFNNLHYYTTFVVRQNGNLIPPTIWETKVILSFTLHIAHNFFFIQGVGGAVQLPDGYLKKAHEKVREHGGVCIADEVQTGFGRLGSHYWGFESQGLMPDGRVVVKG